VMTEAQAMAYASVSAEAMGVPMDEARVARVAFYLVLTSRLADVLDAQPLDVETDPAEVYCPAPFPQQDPVPGTLEPGASSGRSA